LNSSPLQLPASQADRYSDAHYHLSVTARAGQARIEAVTRQAARTAEQIIGAQKKKMKFTAVQAI
jgi:hypothetical protein